MQADDLAPAGLGRIVRAAPVKPASLGHIPTEPHAPAVELHRRGTIEHDAASEGWVVLQQEHHRLVEVLLP
eukprot:scaffold20031_cov111-Isochrysis_galbana.AAC.4